MKTFRPFAPLAFAAALAFAAPVHAAGGDNHGGDHAADHDGGHDDHGSDHADDGHGSDHGDGHGDGHGEGHGDGHHYEYTADADGDGTPNWLDPTDGSEENTHFPLWGVLFHAINLAILFGVLFWFGRRPVGDALANRALSIRKELTESARVRDEAKQRNMELAARLDKIESEIAGMKTAAEKEAQQAEAALIERAEAEAERIKDGAERTIRDEVQRARAALKRDAVVLAVELAENALKERVDADHQQRLAREFLDSLKNDATNDASGESRV
jgi:F-type H+-transporting ATPase subunit b